MMVVMVSPLWVMPLSAPVMADVVVVMHRDSAVNTAVRTITENAPAVQVVEYGSLDYALTIHRAFGRVVWVSHGSEEGILLRSGMMTWKRFSRLTTLTPGRDIVLACESDRVNEYVSSSQAIGIGGTIDATLGGLFVAYLLSPTGYIVRAVWERTTSLVLGSVVPEFLGVVPPWWIAVKAGLVALLTWWYFGAAEKEVPEAVASYAYPPLLVTVISGILTLLGGIGFYLLQCFFPSAAAFLAVVSPIVNVLVGLAIQRVIGGALPGAAYLFGLLAGRVASLFGCTVSIAQPWIRAAFAASAAILTVSIVDFIIVTIYTFLV